MSWGVPALKFQPTTNKYSGQKASPAPSAVNWGLIAAIFFALAIWCVLFAAVLGY